MKHNSIRSKSSRQGLVDSMYHPVTGANGISIAPPAYGIYFVDRQQPAETAHQAGEVAVQQQSTDGSGTPEERKENRTGMPDRLKAGIEALSGLDMSNVRVHYGSDRPAQLNALAYTQGTDIHVAPGQEQHLPHEAWHVVQQAQGRVQPTRQAKGVGINDDTGLEHEADMMGAQAIHRPHPNAVVTARLQQATNAEPRTSEQLAAVEDPAEAIGVNGDQGSLAILSTFMPARHSHWPMGCTNMPSAPTPRMEPFTPARPGINRNSTLSPHSEPSPSIQPGNKTITVPSHRVESLQQHPAPQRNRPAGATQHARLNCGNWGWSRGSRILIPREHGGGTYAPIAYAQQNKPSMVKTSTVAPWRAQTSRVTAKPSSVIQCVGWTRDRSGGWYWDDNFGSRPYRHGIDPPPPGRVVESPFTSLPDTHESRGGGSLASLRTRPNYPGSGLDALTHFTEQAKANRGEFYEGPIELHGLGGVPVVSAIPPRTSSTYTSEFAHATGGERSSTAYQQQEGRYPEGHLGRSEILHLAGFGQVGPIADQARNLVSGSQGANTAMIPFDALVTGDTDVEVRTHAVTRPDSMRAEYVIIAYALVGEESPFFTEIIDADLPMLTRGQYEEIRDKAKAAYTQLREAALFRFFANTATGAGYFPGPPWPGPGGSGGFGGGGGFGSGGGLAV